MTRRPQWLCSMLLITAAPGVAAQTTALRSAPVSDVQYTVSVDSARAGVHQLGVQMTFRTAGADPVLLSLPVWTPGAYEVSNFARDVENFAAKAGSQTLVWDKLDYDTWRVRPTGAQEVTVRFDFVADTLDNAMAWTTNDFALFNGTNVFLYPEGLSKDFSARVTVQTSPGWAVVTGMAPAGQPRTFTAANYHDLVDMPFFVGPVELDSTQIDDKWYRLATYPKGALTGDNRATFWRQMQGLMPTETAVFSETPWQTYTVMMILTPSYPGGSALEHQNSHVGVYNAQFAGNPLLASVTAHEIFHAWNVKRLRPADMFPYEYSHSQPTTLLWVSEGITDYYADLALVRGGVIPPFLFYQITSGKVTNVANAPPTALEDASLSTWIHPVDGSGYIYYDKGSLAGLLIDIMIRDATNNRVSLDQMMRRMYDQFYKQGKGFTTADWWQTVEQLAGGKSFADFAQRYVDGREPFPYAAVLPLAGLQVRADTIHAPRIGVTTTQDSTGVHVTAVTPGTSGAAAGIQPGDYLTKVGDMSVADVNFGGLFRQRYAQAPAGTPLDYTVLRNGQTVVLRGLLQFADNVSYMLEELPNASPKAVRIREGILKGSVSP